MQTWPTKLAGKVAAPGVLVPAAWSSHKGQVLMAARERGYAICKNGGYSKGPTIHGTETAVTIPISCGRGAKAIALFHTHPNGNPLPSPQDMRAVRRLGIPYICVKAGRKTRCYPAKGR